MYTCQPYHSQVTGQGPQDTTMSKYLKKILKNLGEKNAIPVRDIKQNDCKEDSYALARSLKNLAEAGLVTIHESDNQKYAKITDQGRAKLNKTMLEGEDSLVPKTWDGKWRIIILDLPESRKKERENLRYLLKKANFVCMKNTVWVSPYQYEHLFANIKKDLGLSTELMIIVTDKLDPETASAFLRSVSQS